jgi:hypothetical protein
VRYIIPIFFLLLCVNSAAPENHARYKRHGYIEVGPIETLYTLQPDMKIRAFKFVESSFREKVIGDHGEAYGILQFHQARIDDINEIVGYKRFKLEDALNEKIATLMWYIYMSHKNPSYDLKRCCMLWNGKPKKKNARRSKDYYKKIQYVFKNFSKNLDIK